LVFSWFILYSRLLFHSSCGGFFFVALRVAFDSMFLSGLDPKRYYLRFILELIRAFFLILLCLAIASVHPKNRQILKRCLKTSKLWRRLLEVCGSHRYCRKFSVQAKLVRLVGCSPRVCLFFLVDNALAKVCQQQPICSVAVSVFLVQNLKGGSSLVHPCSLMLSFKRWH